MKVIIVDDEPMPAKHLQRLIQKHCFEIKEVIVENSPIEAVKILNNEVFDIIFLDVEMPEINGFELLEEIMISRKTKIIFTTAYSQYAIKAFEANATYYLLKPIVKEDLILAVRRAAESISKEKIVELRDQKVSIYYKDEYNLLDEKEIIRLEAEKSYTNIVIENKKILSSKGIGFYENKLNPKLFFRCHKSHLINLSKIKKIGKGKNGYAVLSNEDIVPISTSKREELQLLLQI